MALIIPATQLQLLAQLLPLAAKQSCFALKCELRVCSDNSHLKAIYEDGESSCEATLDMGKRAMLARQALMLLYRKPVLDAADLEKALEVSTPTANRLITALIDKNILLEITGQQRGRIYVFDRYLKLFIS